MSGHIPAMDPGEESFRNNHGKEVRIDKGFSDRKCIRIEPFFENPGVTL
jgi:hypothetical protein